MAAPTWLVVLMGAEYMVLAVWQLARGEWAWAGMWACYASANFFIAGKQ